MHAFKAALGAVALTFALAGPVGAQYPGTTTPAPTSTQTLGTLSPGQTSTVVSCPFPAGTVNLSVNGTGGATDTVEPDGCARSTVQVLGVSLVRVEGKEFRVDCAGNIISATGGGRTVNTTFNINCPVAAAGGTLPRTGGSILASSLAGGALLAIGSALVVSARRRRASSTTATA